MDNCFSGGKIILANEVLEKQVLVFNDKIIDILEEDRFKRKYPAGTINIIDASGKYVSPGFIDIHIHGSGGKDVMDGTVSDLDAIGKSIAKTGVTGYLPTTMSMERAKIYQALDAIRQAMALEAPGAQILGAHLEGPFISPSYKGAQNKRFLLKPDFELINKYTDIIKIITLAPEEDFQFKFIEHIRNKFNIVLSMGHTSSDYETAMKAIRAGVSNASHLFNAMPPFHHRAPGAVGAVLGSNISFELIADTLHIHPALFQILLNAKGKDKMILVTDSMRATSMHAGQWELGGQEVVVDNDSARLRDGTLAGSILTMNKAVFNIMKYTDLAINEAVILASLNPARIINLDHSKGSIEVGKDADLIVFDEGLEVELSISLGRTIYRKNS